ncbi:S-adenosyl-L-methionine-dependent methyltransferase [Backusella circina FSU 941]|nr:S-adenosyl-L-methionine-dependent methyltransferase [Backusella circina FSU 941]
MGSKKRKDRDSPGNDPRGSKKVIVTESRKFTDYYKTQNIFSSAEEYELFQSYLCKPLPSTFRITGNKSHAALIRDLIEKSYIPDMQGIEVDGIQYDPPLPIPWYPDRLGWQINAPRPVIRRSAPFSKFQKFIMSETEAGNLSRQEAVSMIPPMLLDVKPHQNVLDMCAAPGSKTAQIIEYLHTNDKLNEMPCGLIVANDADYKRSHMLVHQSKRLQSPCFMATNHDASQLPTIHTQEGDRLLGWQFDRVLCDVPCSGDGTLRKNPRIWKDWTPADGLSLHNLQVQIFLRGAQLTKVGGRIVYSTCSFNPVENEAVVAEVLRLSKGGLELLDVSSELPGLKRRPGLTTWNILTKDGHAVNSVEEIRDTNQRAKFPRSAFPPKDGESFGLENCLRVYPQDQNTGGFFIAVFSKVKSMTMTDRIRNNEVPLPTMEEMNKYEEEDVVFVKSIGSRVGLISEEEKERKEAKTVEHKSSTNPNKPKREVRGIKESPFDLVSSDNPDIDEVSDFYGISSDFPRDQYLLRAEDTAKNRCLYFISKAVKDVLKAPDVDQLYIVNTGVRLFVRQGGMTEIGAPFRIANEGLSLLEGVVSDRRRVTIAYDELRILLTEAFPMLEQFEKKTQDKLETIDLGCCVFCVDSNTTNDDKAAATVSGLEMPVWKGKTSLNVLLNKQDKKALCQRIFQVDPEEAPEHIKEKSISGQQKITDE